MSSNVILPHAAPFMVLRSPTPPPKKLASSAFISHRLIASPLSITSSFNSLSLKNRSFVVRAEAEENSEVEPAASSENAEEGVDSEAEAAIVVTTPFKPRTKLGDVMGILNKKAIDASEEIRATPDLRTGDVVQIKLEVPENKRRLSVYKGIVISKQNAGIHTTIRIRRIIAGVGVEIVFPVYSPNIKELKVLSHRKVRRARLYYLRDKLPRLSTFK